MLAVRKILFPTDFSRCSEKAMNHALLFAKSFGAELHFLHAVVLRQGPLTDTQEDFPGEEELLRHMFEVSGSELGKLTAGDETAEITVREETRRGYSAGAVILDYADEIDADMIVMGTHGYRGPMRFFLGSVAEEVVRHAKCPVLTLGKQEEPADLHAWTKILAPVDFSEHSERAVRTAKELAARYGASVELLHVIQSQPLPTIYGPAAIGEGVLERLRTQSLTEMEHLSARAGGPEVEIENTVTYGYPSARINEFAEQNGCDLIVLPTHGLTAIERFLLGSTTEKVVRGAHVPVLTVKSFGKDLVVRSGAEEAKAS